jgi:hypothetical protein
MKQFNPFNELSCAYGSPMGRRGDNPANLQDLKRLHARHQGGGEGYDKGGAYWGYPSNVYGVWGWIDGKPECVYVRASSRVAAIEMVKRGEA